MGLTGLVGPIVASASANRATDSKMLGGQIDHVHMGSRLWNSMEIHGAAWRTIKLQCSFVAASTGASGAKNKTKCLFCFTLDEALQPSRLFGRSHTDRSRQSCDSCSYPGVAMLKVTVLKCWETLSKSEGEQKKSRVVHS